VRDFEAVVASRIISRTVRCAHGGTQGQPADAAHAIDTHFH
jgi:hypothetical protein